MEFNSVYEDDVQTGVRLQEPSQESADLRQSLATTDELEAAFCACRKNCAKGRT